MITGTKTKNNDNKQENRTLFELKRKKCRLKQQFKHNTPKCDQICNSTTTQIASTLRNGIQSVHQTSSQLAQACLTRRNGLSLAKLLLDTTEKLSGVQPSRKQSREQFSEQIRFESVTKCGIILRFTSISQTPKPQTQLATSCENFAKPPPPRLAAKPRISRENAKPGREIHGQPAQGST